MKQYYIYVHRDNDGNTFYIGKGIRSRAFDQDRSQKWYEKANGGYWVEIIADNLDEQTALLVEMCIIKAINPGLTNSKEVKEVIVQDRYFKDVKQLRHDIDSNREQIKKNIAKLKKLQKRIDKLRLTDKETSFIESSKATLPAKLLTKEELNFRTNIASKIKQKSKLESKLNIIKHHLL